MMEMGADRILFSVDYPFVMNKPGTDWLNDLQIATEDKHKIMSGNVRRLLRMQSCTVGVGSAHAPAIGVDERGAVFLG